MTDDTMTKATPIPSSVADKHGAPKALVFQDRVTVAGEAYLTSQGIVCSGCARPLLRGQVVDMGITRIYHAAEPRGGRGYNFARGRSACRDADEELFRIGLLQQLTDAITVPPRSVLVEMLWRALGDLHSGATSLARDAVLERSHGTRAWEDGLRKAATLAAVSVFVQDACQGTGVDYGAVVAEARKMSGLGPEDDDATDTSQPR